MSRDLELECRCGQVHGWVRDVASDTVNRAICYCDDCQAFAHYLGRADLLDPHGGSDLTGLATSTVQFDRGTENIEAMRLSPRGPLRYYASCCKTPLGNTGTRFPFAVGLVYEAIRDARDPKQRDELLGPVQGTVYGKYAVGGRPPGFKAFDPPFIGRAILRMLRWKLRGRAGSHPYLELDGRTPKYPVKTITRGERQTLLTKCGPYPAPGANPGTV